MKAFMTSGTFDFLEKIANKHTKLTFFFMENESSTVAYYEDKKKKVFNAGRAYDILISKGVIKEDGFVVMSHIPLAEEGIPVFESRFKSRQEEISSQAGFQAFRLLKPTKGNTYIVLSQWVGKEYFEHWRDSEEFTKSHHNQAVKPPAYFAKRPFVSMYTMYVEEDEE